MNATDAKMSSTTQRQLKHLVVRPLRPIKCLYCSRQFYGNVTAFKKHVRNHERRYHKHWSKKKSKPTSKFQEDVEHMSKYSEDSACILNAISTKDARYWNKNKSKPTSELQEDTERMPKCSEDATRISDAINNKDADKERVFVYLVYPPKSLCTCDKENQPTLKMPCDCEFLYQRFVYRSIGQMHRNMSQNVKRYSCKQCMKTVTRIPLSSRNCTPSAGEKPVRNHVCMKCGDAFTNSLDLDKHCQACYGYTKSVDTFKCLICGKIFQNTFDVCKHISSCHDVSNCSKSNHSVSKVNSVVDTRTNLYANVQSHSDSHTCVICGYKLVEDETMGSHIAQHSCMDKENVQNHTMDKLHKDSDAGLKQNTGKNQRRQSKMAQQASYVNLPLKIDVKEISKTPNTKSGRNHKFRTSDGVQKVWPCNYCDMILDTSRELKLHLKMHKTRDTEGKCLKQTKSLSKFDDDQFATNTFKCQSCTFIFLSASKLRSHKCTNKEIVSNSSSESQKRQPSIQSKYVCDKCPQSFRSLRQMKSHMKTHLIDDNYTSSGSTLQIPKQLDNHVKIHEDYESDVKQKTRGVSVSENDQGVQDDDTNARTGTKEETTNKSQRVPKYGCKKCDRVCLTIGELRQHRKVHKLRGDNLQCEECKETFPSLEELTQHVDAHKFPCRFCGTEISTPDNRKRHEMNICSLADPAEVKKLYQEKKICCKQCDSVFNDRAEMREHMKSHKYKCTFCNMEFTQEYTRNRHEKSKCGAKVTGSVMLDKKLECKLCGQIFENRIHWRQHSKTHNNERWACQPCDQNFRTRAEFLEHKKTHKGVWCKTCNVSFQTTSELDEHEKEHKFPCQYCGLEFPTIRSCRQHTETACNNALLVKKLKPRKLRKDTGVQKNTEKCECYCDQCGRSLIIEGRGTNTEVSISNKSCPLLQSAPIVMRCLNTVPNYACTKREFIGLKNHLPVCIANSGSNPNQNFFSMKSYTQWINPMPVQFVVEGLRVRSTSNIICTCIRVLGHTDVDTAQSFFVNRRCCDCMNDGIEEKSRTSVFSAKSRTRMALHCEFI